ncbi:sensor histidine kinase [Lentzea albidocapillata]|uniref:histidine kinase n=1 Tax=Lentzea albidocapillata TaxID=40571 RepID=A0A1W2FJA7_9PSEU|nr:ATP-binding protein [Lentzea albidocapillata]SMD22017.1 Signal transduction histidine kinase [Lentzea albidocapillata]
MPATASRPPRFTVRVKLTALYGGLFAGGGALLLTVIYLLMRSQYPFLVEQASHTPSVGSTSAERLPHGVTRGSATAAEADAKVQQVAETIQAMTLDTLLIVSALSLCGVALISVAAGWWLSGRVLRPLHTIIATARRLSSSNLHQRLALQGPRDELTELAETFDDMLDRLESAFDSQRRFVANASHELRTPLAVQRAAVQIGLADNPTPAEAARIREQLLTANRQIERLIDGLLVLARSDRGLDRREPVELHVVVAEVLEQHRAEAARQQVEMHADLSGTTVLGDRDLLFQLVTNLATNAVRHNVSGGTVWINTNSPGVLTVSNTGLPVPAASIPQLFEPFRRGDVRDAAVKGSGLGLSIVESIARAHDASVDARSRDEGGLRIVVTIPTQAKCPP